MSIEEKIATIEGYVAEVDLSDVTESFPLFVTFELSRPVQIQADPTAKFFWVREGGPDVETFEEFGRTASDYLATAVACFRLNWAISCASTASHLGRTAPTSSRQARRPVPYRARLAVHQSPSYLAGGPTCRSLKSQTPFEIYPQRFGMLAR